jgi:hypothetical protein
VALNTSPVRSDVGYLRRRVKPAPVAAAPAAVPAPSQQPAQPAAPAAGLSPSPVQPAAGLSLSPSAPATPAPAARGAAPGAGLSLGSPATRPQASAPSGPVRPAVPPGSLPFAAPTIDEVRELGVEDPVLRLNARESAIGSLIVSSSEAAAWEDADGVTGLATAAGGTAGSPVRTPGNRPLVGYDDADAILALRHAGRLRRALFIARGDEPLGVQIFDGSTVTVARGDDERMFVLYLLRIANLVELRAEPVRRASTNEQILAQFGFTLTPVVVTRESRSR